MPRRGGADDPIGQLTIMLRAAIEWGKWMPPVFVSESDARRDSEHQVRLDRVDEGNSDAFARGEPGWIVSILTAGGGEGPVVDRDPGDEQNA